MLVCLEKNYNKRGGEGKGGERWEEGCDILNIFNTLLIEDEKTIKIEKIYLLKEYFFKKYKDKIAS